MDDSPDIDFDISQNIPIIDSQVYETNANIDDTFIIYFKKEELYIGNVVEINDVDSQIVLVNDINDIVKIKIDEQSNLLLQTDTYSIIDIEKVSEFTEQEEKKDFDDLIVETLKRDIYPEINFQTVEKTYQEYEYTTYEQNQILLSTIIDSFDIHDNKQIIAELSQNLQGILSEKEKRENSYLSDEQHIPHWLCPISTNYKRIYDEEEDGKIIDKPFIVIGQDYENKQLVDIYNTSTNLFDRISKEFYNEFNPTQVVDETIGLFVNYAGNYYMNPKDFSIDQRKTRNSYIYYDSDGYTQTILDEEFFGLDSLYMYPNKYFHMNIKFNMTNLSIPLKTKIDLYNLSKSTDIQKSFNDIYSDGIVNVDISNPQTYSNKKVIAYKTNTINVKDASKQLKKALPSIKDILEDVDIPIYNYKDVDYLLIQYDITHNHMTVEDKQYINELIKKSLESKKQVKLQSKPSKQKQPIPYNPIVDIQTIKKLIFQLTNIPLKNYYLDKFIDKYTKTSVNSNWLLNVYTGEPLLCKHYKTSCKITTDKQAYDSLIDNWAGETIDGIVYCKHCQEYITHEDFSLLEGFAGDKPIQTKEIIQQTEVDELSLLTNTQRNDMKLIRMLSVNVGVDITDEDSIHIIQLYKLIDNDKLADARYKQPNVTNESYPSLVNAKSKVSKEKFKKLKQSIKRYIYDSNKVMFFYVCLLILIQTNVPGYKNTPEGGELLNLKSEDFLLSLSNPSTIDILDPGIKLLVKKIRDLSKNLKGPLWKHCGIFVDEYKNPSIRQKPENQIKHTIQYILSPYYPSIVKKIKTYYINNVSNSVQFLKPYWKTFKPLPDGKLIVDIRNQLNDPEQVKKDKAYYLQKNLIDYMLENSARLIDINSVKLLYEQYSIKLSDIMINPSFYRLYRYTIYLYGIHENSNYINLLIDRFIQTVGKTHKQHVQSIFEKGGWNPLNLSFRTSSIDFSKLKKILVSVINYYKQYDKINIELNDHVIFTNVQLMYLATWPKRIYESDSGNIFSTIDNERLLEKLKKRYCYDNTGKLIINDKHVEHFVSLELPFNKMMTNCSTMIQDISVKKLIYQIHSQTKLEPIYPYIQKSSLYDYTLRLLSFINENDIKDVSIQNLGESTMNQLESPIDETMIIDIYKQIQIETESNLFDFIDFIRSSEQLNQALQSMKSTQTIFGNNFEMIQYLFYPPEPGDANYNQKYPFIELSSDLINVFYEYIVETTSIISNQRPVDSHIPNWWKLSNELSLKEFLQETFLVNHNETYLPVKEKYSYKTYSDKSIYFEKLINNISIVNLSNYLQGSTQRISMFSEDRCMRIKQYYFVKLFHEIQTFVEQLMDDSSLLYAQLSSEFSSMGDEYSIEDCYQTLSKYIIEQVIHILQQYNDPTWIINIDQQRLNEQLSLQKEREKLQLTNKLDQMDANQRYVYVQKQSIGAVNWFKDASEGNQSYIQSEEFKQKTLEERLEYFKMLQQSGQVVSDVLQSEQLGDVNSNFAVNQPEEEQGYYNVQDIDNEGEGEEYLDMNVDDEDIMEDN